MGKTITHLDFIPKDKQRREERRELGLCITCGSPRDRERSRSRCVRCLNGINKRERKRRAQGSCAKCGPEPRSKRALCAICRAESARDRGQLIAKHGMSESPEYRSWKAMKARCLNPNNEHFPHYGGRGITVCDEWKNSFEVFLNDVGLKPSRKHSLERIENDQAYKPGNVRWATQPEQLRNRRNNINITIGNETRCLRDWATKLGIGYSTAFYRHKRGESIV